MQIKQTTTVNFTIREDYLSVYSFSDDPVSKRVVVTIPKRIGVAAAPALPADPDATPPFAGRAARAAVAPTMAFSFVLWQGADYDTAQAMNGGIGYGTPDLATAITAKLNQLAQ